MGARGDDGEIRALGLVHVSQAVESATKLDNLRVLAQNVARVGVYTERDQITSAQPAALVAEGPC